MREEKDIRGDTPEFRHATDQARADLSIMVAKCRLGVFVGIGESGLFETSLIADSASTKEMLALAAILHNLCDRITKDTIDRKE